MSVQIRPWQNIAGLIGVVIDVRVNPYSIDIFKIPKADLLFECEQLKATSAHGTKEANRENSNIELRFSFPISPDNKHYVRWKERYSFDYSEGLS
jgi:hypothetical protein